MANPLSQLEEAGDAVRQTIRAYHGSPYDFDRFDASKIGTGEGNQAFGHGLYLAGNEAVAKSYRDNLSRNSFIVEGAKTPMTESMMDQIGIDTRAQGIIRRAIAEGADPIERLVQMRSGYGPQSEWANRLTDAIDVLRSSKGPLRPNQGRMYEVEISHPEHSFLDWDRLVGEQQEPIRTAVRKLLGSEALGQTGGRAYSGIGKFYGDDLTDAGASKALADLNVPGLKYWDAGSRGSGDGTRNYVMFPGTEDSIRILRKYGLLAPIAAGAASSMPPDENP